MSKKLTKTISFIVVLCLVATCLVGCGKKVNVTYSGNEVKVNGDKIYPIECEDTLSYWFSGTGIWNMKYENYGDTPIGKEITKKTGVKIEYIHPTEGQGSEQFQIMLASDDLPDLVSHTWYSFAGGPDSVIEQEYIYELSDIINKYCPALTKLLKENPDWNKGIKTDLGNYYSFPTFVDKAPLLKVVYGPIVRKDYLNELSLGLPVTIDDWEILLTKLKGKGVEIPYWGNATEMCTTFYPAFGGYQGWYHDDGVVKYGEAQPQYKQFLAKMNDWYNKGLIYEDFAVSDSNKFNADLLNGNIGVFTGYAGSGLGTFLDANEGKGTFDLTGVQCPVMKEGDINAEYSKISNEVSTGITTAISTNCKNIELAARFLDFGFTEEGHNVYNFGVEGESYNWIEKEGEAYPLYSELVYNNPEGLTISDVLHMYTRAAHLSVPMVQDVRYIEQYYPHQQQKDSQVEWAKTNMVNHIMPPIYILGEENDTDADIMAAVKTYVDEMTIKFITGRESLDKFDEYIKQLEAFGIEQSVKFRQEALKRYNNR